MIFRDTGLEGAWLIEPERIVDERGFFARTFCRDELAERGLEPAVAQCSISFNERRGTLRGLHFQIAPHEEVKLVRCTRGAAFDVIVDLRPDSATFRRHFALELSADNRLELYVPRGFAHGFQTLAAATEIAYQISEPYSPGHGRGYRYDDPAFGIDWPLAPTAISDKDLGLPHFAEETAAR